MTTPKPCPFCGQQPIDYTVYGVDIRCKCGMTYPAHLWNTRPIEDALSARIAKLEAELAALRPLAEVGKRAVSLYWWWHEESEPHHCLMCMTADGHAADCPIPSLLAQLEADNAITTD